MSRRSKSEQRANDRENIRLAGLRYIMESSAARLYMFDLLDRRCKLFSGSFCVDPYLTAHAEGGRGVGITIAKELQEVVSGQYVQMIEEQFNEQHKDRLIDEISADEAKEEGTP